MDATTPAVTVVDLKTALESGRDLLLIDVRTRTEHQAGAIAKTDLLIPYDQLPACTDSLPVDRTAEIYFYCRSGRRSGITTRHLQTLGYTNVYNVVGGIIAWVNAGYEIVPGDAP